MKKIIIALDGFSGTGKSSTAKRVAAELGYTYIDTGAMYRAITLFFIRNNIDYTNPVYVQKGLDQCSIAFKGDGIYLNGEYVEKEIRSMRVSNEVSAVSTISEVRSRLVDQQRALGRNKGVVMDGRDIGSVVYPNAELKLFMTASEEVRVERRQKQLAAKGILEKKQTIRQNLLERDKIDSNRVDSPLVKARGAIEIDTSELTLNEQVEKIVSLAEKIIHED